MTAKTAILHQGKSITLRRTMPEDAAFLYQVMYCNPEFMRLFRLNDEVQSEAQLRERLNKRWQVSPAKSGYLELLMIHRNHGAIGILAAADYVPLHRRAEFLIGLFDPQYYYTGYSIEASLMMGDLVFNQYKLHRFYAYSYAYNQHAHKALNAGGFTLEGVMKDHVFDRLSHKFVDLYVFGLTVEQFRQNQRIAKLSRHLLGRDITILPSSLESKHTQSNHSPPPQKTHLIFRKSGSLVRR